MAAKKQMHQVEIEMLKHMTFLMGCGTIIYAKTFLAPLSLLLETVSLGLIPKYQFEPVFCAKNGVKISEESVK